MLGKIRNQVKELETEIQRKTKVEEQRRQFVNNVSHEIKTPLAIISSQVEILDFIDDDIKIKDYHKSIIDETTKISDMVNDMMLIYTAQNENETMPMEETDITDMMKQCCLEHEMLVKNNNLMLDVKIEEGLTAMANSRYLSQAVGNYITNSIKYSDEADNINIRAFRKGEQIRIEVENHGGQIPDGLENKIWDMFYSGGGDLNGQTGSGIGLSIVKSIVTLHDGKYGYENCEDGIVFFIELNALSY